MKRDELKAIEGLTDTQIDAIMALHGKDSTAWNTRLKTAEDTAAKFKDVDLDALNKQIQDLTAEKAQIIYDGTVTRAIEKAGGRSVKAIRALLDEDTLRKSQTLEADLTAAIEEVKKKNDWAFENPVSETSAEKPKEPAARVSTGAEHGSGGEATDAVTEAFLALNPGMKL